MDHRLRHWSKDGLGALEPLVAAADHERQGAGRSSGNPAGHGRIDKLESQLLEAVAHLEGALNVDRRAVDQQGAGPGVRRDIVVVDLTDVFRGWKHGDHHVGVLHRFGSRAGRSTAGGGCVLHRLGNKVERPDLVTCLGEIRRHSAAHVAETDECDTRHG